MKFFLYRNYDFDFDKKNFQTSVEDSDESEIFNISDADYDNKSLDSCHSFHNNINENLLENDNKLFITGLEYINEIYDNLKIKEQQKNDSNKQMNTNSFLINNNDQLIETNFNKIENLVEDKNAINNLKNNTDICCKLLDESLENSDENAIIENDLTESNNINLKNNDNLFNFKINAKNTKDKNFQDQSINNFIQENLNHETIQKNCFNEKKNDEIDLTDNNNQINDNFSKIENNKNCLIQEQKNKSLNLLLKKVPYNLLE